MGRVEVQVPSKSMPNDYHAVIVSDNGVESCDCIGWEFTGSCGHGEQAINYIKTGTWKHNQ